MADEAPAVVDGAPADAPSGAETGAPAPEAPPWGEDFDPARAWKTIQSLREAEKSLAAKVKGYEKAEQEKADAEKTEAQRLAERAERAEAEAAAARRELLVSRALRTHGLPDDLAEFLTGKDEAEIEARAKVLAERLAKPTAPEVPAKPRPRLSPGESGAPAAEAFDPAALVAAIKRNPY